MRLDPEDYAFLTCYSPARVAKATQRRCAQLRSTLVSMLITVAIMAFWWFESGRPRPSDVLTWRWLWLLAATLIITAVVGLVAVTTSRTGARQTNILLRLLALATLAAPVAAWWMAWQRVRTAPPSGPMPGLYQTVTWLLLVLALVTTLCWLGAVVLSVRWMGDHRGLGWLARRLSQVTAIVALGPWLLTWVAWLVLGGTVNSASGIYGWLNDSTIWLWLGLIAICAVTLSLATLQTIDLAILAASLQQRPALRIDPLGLVLDEVAGPVRVPWASVRGIGAQAQSLLPGPQLRVRRDGAPDWLVPFSFLDVMPGTIDSAIRAHTHDQHVLDLAQLDQIW
jgi:MFS family permease